MDQPACRRARTAGALGLQHQRPGPDSDLGHARRGRGPGADASGSRSVRAGAGVLARQRAAGGCRALGSPNASACDGSATTDLDPDRKPRLDADRRTRSGRAGAGGGPSA